MSQDFGYFEKSFEPSPIQRPIEYLIPSLAENLVIKTIIDGSGGPDNQEMTTSGLKFVRYLLSTSRAARHGFVPNFKDLATIERVAKNFISRCGSPYDAMEKVIEIADSQDI